MSDKFKCICDPDYPFEPPNPTPVAVAGCPAHRVRRSAQLMTIEMIRQEDFQAAHAADPLPAPDHCVVDGRPILTMSFKGTGVCGELCRKVRDGELTLEA